jgi:hypothetical protein
VAGKILVGAGWDHCWALVAVCLVFPHPVLEADKNEKSRRERRPEGSLSHRLTLRWTFRENPGLPLDSSSELSCLDAVGSGRCGIPQPAYNYVTRIILGKIGNASRFFRAIVRRLMRGESSTRNLFVNPL